MIPAAKAANQTTGFGTAEAVPSRLAFASIAQFGLPIGLDSACPEEYSDEGSVNRRYPIMLVRSG